MVEKVRTIAGGTAFWPEKEWELPTGVVLKDFRSTCSADRAAPFQAAFAVNC